MGSQVDGSGKNDQASRVEGIVRFDTVGEWHEATSRDFHIYDVAFVHEGSYMDHSGDYSGKNAFRGTCTSIREINLKLRPHTIIAMGRLAMYRGAAQMNRRVLGGEGSVN